MWSNRDKHLGKDNYMLEEIKTHKNIRLKGLY